MPNVLHEEPQKPQVTPLRFPAEGEPREREREAAKIVVMENTNGSCGRRRDDHTECETGDGL